MKRILSYLALIGVLSACGAGNTTPPTQNGSNHNTLPTCGTFTTSNDSKGTAFNGQTSEPLSSSFTSGNLSGVGIGCNTQGVFSGKRIIRAIRIDLVTPGSITASLSYPANVSYKETDVGTPCGTFGCPTLEWKNTPGSSDVRIESITGDTYRFVYSNLVLKPVDSAKGNLGLSADFTTKLRN
jgi:hypothetical protein